jgi:hypothetical protein
MLSDSSERQADEDDEEDEDGFAEADAEWAAVDRRAISIAGRAVSTMTAASGLNDVVRMHFATQRDGIDYNLAFIRPDFTGVYTEPFEQSYMRELYDYGEALGRRGYVWAKEPPLG